VSVPARGLPLLTDPAALNLQPAAASLAAVATATLPLLPLLWCQQQAAAGARRPSSHCCCCPAGAGLRKMGMWRTSAAQPTRGDEPPPQEPQHAQQAQQAPAAQSAGEMTAVPASVARRCQPDDRRAIICPHVVLPYACRLLAGAFWTVLYKLSAQVSPLPGSTIRMITLCLLRL